MPMREPVNITVSRILKRKTESKRHLYDALAILEGGGQPRLEHNAHALASGADLLRKGQVQTSDEALWAIEGNLAKYDWPPPRLKLWKKALEAYMECSAASSYRRSLYENRQTRIQDGVRKVLKRGNPMEAINKRVRRILKQGTDADRLEEKLEAEEYLELMDINEDVDIAEDHSRVSALEDLIAVNIEFLVKGEGFDVIGTRFKLEEFSEAIPDQTATDTVLGSWSASFKDGSSFVGNGIADGILLDDGVFNLTSISIGSRQLGYFG